MSWSLVYTKQAQKDAKKLATAGLKPKAEALLDILRIDPFRNPPPHEKLVGDLSGGLFPTHQYPASLGLPSPEG